MLRLPGLIYLDPEKTGSTFIRRFLAATVKGAPENTLDTQRSLKHRPTRSEKIPGMIYLASTRHPLDQYLSLYRFGQVGKGAFRASMNRAGLAYLYKDEHINEWFEFITSAKARPLFDEMFNIVPDSVTLGPASLRLIKACVPFPKRLLKKVSLNTDIEEAFLQQDLTDHLVRQEHLYADLEAFIRNAPPQVFDLTQALSCLHSSSPVNTTENSKVGHEVIEPRLKNRIQELDALVIKHGGYAPLT